ncbi:hypothetical protein D3C85_1661590 [compost metagenome]
MFSVIGVSTTGTAEEAAAARDSRTALRSEHSTSNVACVKGRRAPVVISVAEATIKGPCPLLRSPNVAP